MLREVLQLLLDTLLQPFAAILLLRFHLQWLRAPMRNPAGEMVMGLTDFLVLRARRFVPPTWGYDTASLLLAVAAQMLYLLATIGINSLALHEFSAFGLVAWTLVKLLKLSMYLLMGALFLQAVLSWVNPHTPITALLNAITYPFLSPLQRRIPPLGNIDLSTLILFIACQILLAAPLTALEGLALRLL
jgi:YggT family protein